ncbi:conserved hypothetical protein [Cupriavidus taiwanensis]|uniref:multiubiquitin domain-containing protein n=1 Tax=Cupriavidus taiwanensis TaxID=164546 RepID=UPI000E127E62|nr:multiubiquitin domain-containing protein [Cupriavidus taiwanensis]SPA28037.1 conserved hypothetical protein [Cupriavidus taiwanensis]
MADTNDFNPAPNARHGSYSILVARDGVNFVKIEMDDPVPLGRQILTAAGMHGDDNFSLFNILGSGDFEDVRLDEQIDLRRSGAERFIAFKSDRKFKLTVNGGQVVWGLPTITGADLYALSKPADGEAVFMVVRGGEDRQIEPQDDVDLTAPGVEHFENAPKHLPKIVIIVNGTEEEMSSPHVTFEQLVALAYPGQPPQPNITYSITYYKVASYPHQGPMAPGGSVEAKNGSIFNVGRTIQS